MAKIAMFVLTECGCGCKGWYMLPPMATNPVAIELQIASLSVEDRPAAQTEFGTFLAMLNMVGHPIMFNCQGPIDGVDGLNTFLERVRNYSFKHFGLEVAQETAKELLGSG